MSETRARLLPDTPEGVRAAAAVLADGGLVAFPTETVYGLGGDARSDRAVASIFAAKGRPAFNPLIVHVPGLAEAEALAHVTPEAAALAGAFWPGPLTLVLRRRAGAGLSALVSGGLDTIALRAPAHPLARELLDAFGGPLAGPSANPSGRVSPTTAAHVLEGLDDRVAAVLDGGASPVGVESTILGFGAKGLVLLRPGGLPVEAIEAALGRAVGARSGGGVSAPGQLASHYAPRAKVRLGAAGPAPGEAWLGFGPDPALDPGTPALNLSRAGDLTEAAANLFAHLRALDRAGGRIAVAAVPETGLGRAINDRLRRAAAPRG